MSANLIRYLPGGKTVVVGVKPLNATPVIPYYRGNPKYKPCFTSSQLKNAKELIPVPCCVRPTIPGKLCIIYDGGNAYSNFNTLLTSNGLSSIILDSSNPPCPHGGPEIKCIIYDGGNANSIFTTILGHNSLGNVLDSKNAYTNFCG
jgi:hypothetical protein